MCGHPTRARRLSELLGGCATRVRSTACLSSRVPVWDRPLCRDDRPVERAVSSGCSPGATDNRSASWTLATEIGSAAASCRGRLLALWNDESCLAQPPPGLRRASVGRAVSDARAQAWMLHACCRGVSASAFFPSDGSGVEAAQQVCQTCPVRIACLEYALVNRLDHGVWGGTSERERQRILRTRRTSTPAARPS